MDGAEHAPEISTTPGMAMRRRSEREWQYLAHGCSKPFWGSFTRGRPASRADPLRQMLPFSLRSSPPSHPGRCGYLRGMFCALSYSKTPLDGLGSGTRSRQNLVHRLQPLEERRLPTAAPRRIPPHRCARLGTQDRQIGVFTLDPRLYPSETPAIQ